MRIFQISKLHLFVFRISPHFPANENLEVHKDAHEQIIEIGLVETFSTQTVFHLVTTRIGPKLPVIISIYDDIH